MRDEKVNMKWQDRSKGIIIACPFLVYVATIISVI